MFDYLQKFNNLPQNLRDSVSSPAAMAVISELEKKYKVDLAAIVMKVMVKMIPLADLAIYFVSDFSLNQEAAKNLTSDLKERLFFPVANYLGYNASYSRIIPKTVLAPVHLAGVDKVVKDSGVVFASLELSSRFKNIVTTYLKGIRSRIDTRLTLNKEVIAGGLGLDYKIIDQVFKIADEVIASQTLETGELIALPTNSTNLESAKSGLDKVRALYEKPGEARDIPYDLQQSIATGAIKKPAKQLNLAPPIEAKVKLLEEPEENLLIAAAPTGVKTKLLAEPEERLMIPVAQVVIKNSEPVKKIDTPEIIKVSTPINTVKPAAAPIDINLGVKAAVTSAVTSVAAVTKATEAIELAGLAVAGPLKISRPPERPAGLFSKMFHKENHEPLPTPAPENKEPIISAPRPSITSLRAEAANQIKPIIKTTPSFQAAGAETNSTPKVMGPIDELRYLDLVNLRRFSADHLEAISKVESKIRLLEKDSYDKMVLGVLAWRDGIINSIYLKMGQEALAKGITFKQLADDYKISKKPGCLFWEEIEAIMALNSRLMF